MESHQQMLAQATRYVAGSLGHELNNHLTVIVGNLALAKRQAPEADKALQNLEKAVEDIHNKTRGLTTLAQELGGARQTIDFKATMEGALAKTTEMGLVTAQDLAALETSSPIQVRMDPTMLPMALYFAVYAFCDLEAPPASVSAHLLQQNELQITVSGQYCGIEVGLAEQASSLSPEIILGQDAIAIGLSATKAFTHRCQGRLEIALAADKSGAIKITLPVCSLPPSFLKPEKP